MSLAIRGTKGQKLAGYGDDKRSEMTRTLGLELNFFLNQMFLRHGDGKQESPSKPWERNLRILPWEEKMQIV